MVGEFILLCFHARTNAHVLHLETRSYAAHKALNEFYDEIVDLADSFAEAYIGSYGLIEFPETPYEPHTDALKLLDEMDEVAESAREALTKGDTHLLSLLSILDEITALVASTRYKLRFLK